jgi:hypothetical protein
MLFSSICFGFIYGLCRHLNRVCGDIPIIVCGNKVDIQTDTSLAEHLLAHSKKRQYEFLFMSVKQQWEILRPFLRLARILTGEKTLYFVPPPAVMPPWITSLPVPSEVSNDIPTCVIQDVEDDEEENWLSNWLERYSGGYKKHLSN